MHRVARSERGILFDDRPTLETTAIAQDDIFLHNAEGPNLHVVAQSSSAVNDGGRMDEQDSGP